uniref:Sperm-associated antigen 6-like n=1 Tax=Gouania willdenowi TaxID=441366 RepID=A0A8C5GHG9_GOUWI
MEVADLSNNPVNIPILQKANVISQLHPLLSDVVPSIQQTAVFALGKLADHSKELATIVVKEYILPPLFESILFKNIFFKKAVTLVVSAVAKHSPELSQAVVDCGALETLVLCLEDFDPGVQEAAAWALGIIAQHNAMLSQAVVNAGAVPILVTSLQEPEVAIKRNAASALSEISKHTPELAQMVMNNGAIAHLAQVIFSPDAKLKRQALSALSQISKHSVDLAEMVITANIFPAVMVCFRDPDVYVKKNIIILMRDVVKHSADLSQVIVNCGGLAEVMDYLGKSHGSMRLPGIMMLGYVAAHSEILAMSVILSKGVHQLAICLSEENEDHIKAATVLSIGQIGHHTPEHANAVASAGLLPKVLQLYMEASSSEDLRVKSEETLKNILQKCTYLPSLEPLLYDAPSNILKHVLGQFSVMLPHDIQARQKFVRSGGLRKVQEINAESGSVLQEQINAVNICFPKEIVQYYTPGYSEKLLELLENNQPSYVDHFTLETQEQLCWQHQMEVMEARETHPRVESPWQTPQMPQAVEPCSPPPHTHPREPWRQGTESTLPPILPPLRGPPPVPTHATMSNHPGKVQGAPCPIPQKKGQHLRPGIYQRTPASGQVHSQQRPDPKPRGNDLLTSYTALHQKEIKLRLQTAHHTDMQTTAP